MPTHYEIKIKGHLNVVWSDWFEDLKVTQLADNETMLSGQLPDQTALHGLLKRIRDLNLTLISITSDIPSTLDSTKQPEVKTS